MSALFNCLFTPFYSSVHFFMLVSVLFCFFCCVIRQGIEIKNFNFKCIIFIYTLSSADN